MPLAPMPALAATADACSKFAEIDMKREKEWEECSQWWQQAFVDAKELLDGIIAQVAGASSAHVSVKCSGSQDQHDHTNTQDDLAPPRAGLAAQGDSAEEPAAFTADKGKAHSVGEQEFASEPSRASTAALGTAAAESTSDLKAANPNAAAAGRGRGSSRSCTQEEEDVPDEDATIENTNAAGAAKRGREARVASGAGAAAPAPVKSESSKKQDSKAADNDKENLGNASPAHKRSKRLEWRPPEDTSAVDSKKGHPPAAPSSQSPPPASSNAEIEAALLSDAESSAIAAEISALQAITVSSMKVVELRAELRKLGVSSTGLKAVLQTKLQDAIEARLAELQGEVKAHHVAQQALANSVANSVAPPPVAQEEHEEMADANSNNQEDNAKMASSAPSPARSSTVAAAQDVVSTAASGPVPGVREQVGAQTRLSGTRWSGASEACSPIRVFSPRFTEAGKGGPAAAGSTADNRDAQSPSLLPQCAAADAMLVSSPEKENDSVHGDMDLVGSDGEEELTAEAEAAEPVELAAEHGHAFAGTAQMEMDDAEDHTNSDTAEVDGKDRDSSGQAAGAVAETLGASAATAASAAAAPIVPLETEEDESWVDVPASPDNSTTDGSEKVSVATGKGSTVVAGTGGEEAESGSGDSDPGRRTSERDAGVGGDKDKSDEAAGDETEEGEIRVVPSAEEPLLAGASDLAVEGAGVEEASTRDDMDVEQR